MDIEAKIESWHKDKPANFFRKLGQVAGMALGFMAGASISAYHFMPTILNQGPLELIKEGGESAILTSVCTAVGAIALARAGASLDNFIQNPDK